MMIHAWDNYKLYAWGKNELRPLSKRAHTGSIFGANDLGATIIDGLDTLYIMGLNTQFEEGRDWLQRRFTLDNVVSVFLFNYMKCKRYTKNKRNLRFPLPSGFNDLITQPYDKSSSPRNKLVNYIIVCDYITIHLLVCNYRKVDAYVLRSN